MVRSSSETLKFIGNAMKTEPSEKDSDTGSKEFEETEAIQKPSIVAGVIVGVVWLLLLAFILYLMTRPVPILKVILADLLGPGATLPSSTLLVLQISDAIKNNLIICLIIGCIPSLALAYFMGFKERHINPTLCKIIDSAAVILYAGALFYIFTAMLLPFQRYTGEELKK